MDVTFANGTGQQRQWVHDAIDDANFPFASLAARVVFHFATPPVPDHSAFACTQQSSGDYIVTIRPDLDAPNREPVFSGKAFFLETVTHELGHVAQSVICDAPGDHNDFCAMFGAPTGDWAISEATPQGWETSVIEAVAETFKDFAFGGRRFDNRTRWRLPQQQMGAFIGKFIGAAPQTFNDWGGVIIG